MGHKVQLAACSRQEAPLPESTTDAIDAGTALHALFDEHFERTLEMNPIYATSIGDYRFNDRLANRGSAEYRAAAEAMDREFLDRLLEIDRDALGYQDQLSYDIFRVNREQALEGYQFPFHLQPENQFYSTMSSFVRLGSGASTHPFRNVKDYEDFLKRADQFAVNVDTSESDPARVDPDELPGQFDRETAADPAQRATLSLGDSTWPLFRMVLGAILVLLLLETFLARQFGVARG